jgi:HPr Serine kinase C-terminal domain
VTEASLYRLDDRIDHDVDLPFSGTFYPVGFRVEITTNSRDVLAAASESWGMYGKESDRPPVRLRIIVQEQGGLAPEPVVRGQAQRCAIVSDRDNFAFCDGVSRFGYAYLSAKTVADRPWFRWHFLEAMAYVLLVQWDAVPVHAACVEWNGTGVLLCGASGAGKSTLAFSCARAGWTYIADDAAWLLPDVEDRSAVGRCHHVRLRQDAGTLFPEVGSYAAKARPNGKLTIEVPLAEFPEIRTAVRSRIGVLVQLDRRPGARATATEVPSEQIVDRLIADMPSYGDEVNGTSVATARRLITLPAYRLEYDDLAQTLPVLSNLV